MATEQQPIELILARGLMSNLTTPALLVDSEGVLVFFNEAASDMLGMRFEEAGRMGREDWGARFQPMDEEGNRIPLRELPVSVSLVEQRPVHGNISFRSATGVVNRIEVSAFPIMGTTGLRGAMAIFWGA